ncbi:4337_t:CDS:2 [Racocetra fulgida]|uniref:4337_t:CDS:1 n=1 Tax=Racocetra fulgida TaxID=60492 RepID=A0A9N8WJ42_9GLOM|nr:4337_t:CDS:2 [Racocetra fulgida]
MNLDNPDNCYSHDQVFHNVRDTQNFQYLQSLSDHQNIQRFYATESDQHSTNFHQDTSDYSLQELYDLYYNDIQALNDQFQISNCSHTPNNFNTSHIQDDTYVQFIQDPNDLHVYDPNDLHVHDLNDLHIHHPNDLYVHDSNDLHVYDSNDLHVYHPNDLHVHDPNDLNIHYDAQKALLFEDSREEVHNEMVHLCKISDNEFQDDDYSQDNLILIAIEIAMFDYWYLTISFNSLDH